MDVRKNSRYSKIKMDSSSNATPSAEPSTASNSEAYEKVKGRLNKVKLTQQLLLLAPVLFGASNVVAEKSTQTSPAERTSIITTFILAIIWTLISFLCHHCEHKFTQVYKHFLKLGKYMPADTELDQFDDIWTMLRTHCKPKYVG